MGEPLTAEEFEGHWKLLDWVQEYDDGRAIRPFGDEVDGMITYGGGRMSAIIAKAGRPPFTTGGQWNADAAEKAGAYDTCMAYAGRYTFSGDAVVHHVEMSLFPNWVGANQRRRVEWDGTKLRLTARLEEGTPEARTAVLEWRRWTPDH